MSTRYKLITALIALTGDISLIITGEINTFFLIPGLLLFTGYYRSIKGFENADSKLISTLSIITMILFFLDAIVISGDVILAVAHLTIIFHALKSFDLRIPWDSLQVVFIALLQLLITSDLTNSMAFAVFFIIFLVLLVFLMTYSHVIKENNESIKPFIKPAIGIVILTFLLTTLFFMTIPRLRSGLWGWSNQRAIKSGFSENVELGTFGEVKLDSTIVMRVSLEPSLKNRPYWRGITFETYNDNTWRDRGNDTRRINKKENLFTIDDKERNNLIKQEIILEPLDTNILFTIKNVSSLEGYFRYINTDNDGTFSLPFKKRRQMKYTVYSTGEPLLVNESLSAYLQFPESEKETMQLALSLTEDSVTALEKTEKMSAFFRKDFVYSLSTSKPPEGRSSVEYFLFTTKRGYCEHYATAMVLMLRAAGVPARVVSGFWGGEYNQYGDYIIVRQSDAHTWVEAAVDGKWVSLEPTPPYVPEKRHAALLFLDLLKHNWNRYIVRFSKQDQQKIFRFVTSPVNMPLRPYIKIGVNPITIAALISMASILILLFFLFGKRRQRYSGISRYYNNIRAVISRKLPIKESFTASEIAFRLEAVDMETAACFREFYSCYGKARFGGRNKREYDSKCEESYKKLYGKIKALGKAQWVQALKEHNRNK